MLNYSKARDWEVLENAKRGYPEAIEEARKRGLVIPARGAVRGTFWAGRRTTND